VLLTRPPALSVSHLAGATFDAVTALEVIEHVADPQGFLASLAALVKPWGAVCLSTINRTPRSYAVAVVGAERIAGLLPVGTHDWEQFLTPGAGIAPDVGSYLGSKSGFKPKELRM